MIKENNMQNLITFKQISTSMHLNLNSSDDWQQQPFNGFVMDSRQVQQGQIFVALKGTVNSTAEQIATYAQNALAQGALAVITELDDLSHAMQNPQQVLYIPQLRQLLGELQQRYLQGVSPQTLARAIAVTGTNGKTTVSRLIAELLTLLGQATAVMGTTGNGILPNLTPSTHTTLQAIDLQNLIYQYSQQGAKFIALEASSHGLEQGRLDGTAIEIASFSNLSRDHLDYHGTLQQYAQEKAKLFNFPSLKYVIIHQDADFADLMIETAQKNTNQPQIITYSLTGQADYRIGDIQFSLNGATFTLSTPQQKNYTVHSPLLGQFNVANVVQAMISVEKLGFDMADIVALVPQLKGASGRMQAIMDQARQRLFIVDYAHTPDALEQVLSSLRHHVDGKLWAVFGCGGDRDKGKRPMMTQIALHHADKTILTSDNPRTENPEQILADMQAVEHFDDYDVLSMLDRREAIKYAVKNAQQGDIVVVAGKGHENYQEIDGVRHWFDDVIEVQSALDNLACQLPNTVQA